ADHIGYVVDNKSRYDGAADGLSRHALEVAPLPDADRPNDRRQHWRQRDRPSGRGDWGSQAHPGWYGDHRTLPSMAAHAGMQHDDAGGEQRSSHYAAEIR